MKCDNCRWFNKNGFASGTGDCVLHRFVCGSGHEACVHYEEYEPRPHGTWVDVPKYKGFYVCSNCLKKLDGDFERFDHWEMKRDNFCSVCGSDNRKRGEKANYRQITGKLERGCDNE